MKDIDDLDVDSLGADYAGRQRERTELHQTYNDPDTYAAAAVVVVVVAAAAVAAGHDGRSVSWRQT